MASPGTFAQGNPYRVSESGVGAFIPNAADQKDPFDAYLTTRDITNRWRAQKELENDRKAALMRQSIADLTINTKGIRPASVQEALKMKENMVDHITKMRQAGGNLLSPQSIDAYGEGRALMETSQTIIDGDVELNDAINKYNDEVLKNPGKVNSKKWDEWNHQIAQAPMVGYTDENGQRVKSATELWEERPQPRQKSFVELFTETSDKWEPSKTTVEEDGTIYEIQGYEQDTPEFIAQMVEAAPYKDAYMEEWSNLMERAESGDQSAKDMVAGINNLPGLDNYTPEQKYAISTAQKILKRDEMWKAETAEKKAFARESARLWGLGEEDAKQLNMDNWARLKTEIGNADVYELDDKGRMIHKHLPGNVVGKYKVTNPADVEAGKIQDDVLLDFQYDVDENGRPLYRYRSSKTTDEAIAKKVREWVIANPDKQMTTTQQEKIKQEVDDQDLDYVTTNDRETVGRFYTYKYGEKQGAARQIYQDFLQRENVYNAGMKISDEEKARKKITEPPLSGEKRLLDWQQANIDRFKGEGATARTPFPKTMTDNFYTRMTPKQKDRYRVWKKENPDKQPTLSEFEGILGFKTEDIPEVIRLEGEIDPSTLQQDIEYDVGGSIYIWDGEQLVPK